MTTGLLTTLLVTKVVLGGSKKGKGKTKMPAHTEAERQKGKGSRSNIYGVFLAPGGLTGNWAMTRNKRQALKEAKDHKGFVKVLKDDPAITVWDRATFLVSSESVRGGDFRMHHVKRGDVKALKFKTPSQRISQRSLDKS